MKRRMLGVVLSMCMLACAVPVYANAEEPAAEAAAETPDAEVVEQQEVEGDWKYFIRNDGTVMIADYNGDATELVIPDTIAGCPVTSIRGDAFSGQHLSHIEIPESVTNIEEGAFRGESLVDIEVSAQNTMYTVYEGCLYDKQYDFVKIS